MKSYYYGKSMHELVFVVVVVVVVVLFCFFFHFIPYLRMSLTAHCANGMSTLSNYVWPCMIWNSF